MLLTNAAILSLILLLAKSSRLQARPIYQRDDEEPEHSLDEHTSRGYDNNDGKINGFPVHVNNIQDDLSDDDTGYDEWWIWRARWSC